MMDRDIAELRIDVVATTISGSISDWGKLNRIVPLFQGFGLRQVTLHTVDSHAAARATTCQLVIDGARTIISAGGSGTFNSVVQGCIDSHVPLAKITLGFLRKGSADLIGKAIGMPDEIEEAVSVFVRSLRSQCTVPCDVLQAQGGGSDAEPRHFLGYGGTGIFGRIPHYTENRFNSYYKGILGQFLGDRGPFFVGALIATLENAIAQLLGQRTSKWLITVDGQQRSSAAYQAMIIVNGDLGPDLPFAEGVPLGSGSFHLFAFRDLGILKVPLQFKKAWDGSILNSPERWGFESYLVKESLQLQPLQHDTFPANTDGSTYVCVVNVSFRIVDQLDLIANCNHQRPN